MVAGQIGEGQQLPVTLTRAGGSWLGKLRRSAARSVKFGIVAAVLAPGVWLSLDEFVLTTSRDAMVVANTVTLRSPIPGVLRSSVLTSGDIVTAQQVVASVENPRVDDSRLAELVSRSRSLDAQIEAATGSIGRLQGFLGELKDRGSKYSRFRVTKLASLLEAARGQLVGSRAAEQESAERLERARLLVAQGLASQEVLAEREREHSVASASAASTKHSLDALIVERDSMKVGVTLDAYSDQPYSLQRLDEVDLALMKAQATLDEQLSQKRAIAAQLEEERRRVELLRNAQVAAPTEGRVWRILATNGEYVNPGQPLLELVQCSRLMVVAELSARKYARIEIGTRATFHPKDRKGTYSGIVAQKLVEATSAVDAAVAPAKFKVAIRFPALAAQLGAQCDVGVLGDVTFDP